TVKATGQPDGEIYVTADNVGSASIIGTGTPVQLVDTLPRGLRAVGIAGSQPESGAPSNLRATLPCSLKPQPACTLAGELAPFSQLEMRIAVVVQPGAESGESNGVAISGGDAPSASISRPVTLSDTPTPSGVESYELTPEEENGVPATQAGAHPFQLTTTIDLNQTADTNPVNGSEPKPEVYPVGLVKDLNFRWPPGLVGNPTPIAQCTAQQFSDFAGHENENDCPLQSVVGVASVTVNTTKYLFEQGIFTVPLFNLVPRVGEPARFGFVIPIAELSVYIDASVRTGSDYGITVNVHNTTQTAAFMSSEVTVWGVPGDPRHDAVRGSACLLEAEKSAGEHGPCQTLDVPHPPPFLQMPTSCTGPLSTSVESDSWEEPMPAGEQQSFPGAPMPAIDGCN